MDENDLELKKSKPFKIITTLNIIIVCLFLAFSCFFFASPKNRLDEKHTIIHISQNDNLNIVASSLKEKRVIRSIFFLKSFVFLFKLDGGIDKGDYLFKKNDPVFTVAWRLAKARHNIDPIKITLREGLNNQEMADILTNKIPNFQKDLFLEKVVNKQGYLFPDTYFFFPLDSVEEIIKELSNNFNNQLNKVKTSLNSSSRSLSDLIIMASLIEGEAKGESDAYLISGILWKRIKLGIALQVDVDKSTYKERGLPDKPINNPGLISIKAALEPKTSPYLYYLHDKDGIVHFAKNFEEHKSNINKYLR